MKQVLPEQKVYTTWLFHVSQSAPTPLPMDLDLVSSLEYWEVKKWTLQYSRKK